VSHHKCLPGTGHQFCSRVQECNCPGHATLLGHLCLHVPETGSQFLCSLPRCYPGAPARAPAPSRCAQTRLYPAESVSKQMWSKGQHRTYFQWEVRGSCHTRPRDLEAQRGEHGSQTLLCKLLFQSDNPTVQEHQGKRLRLPHHNVISFPHFLNL
jgi:hypothetical protein